MDIVRVPQRMTLAQFADRYGSAVPVEELAVINHVMDPSRPLEAGTLLKHVVS
jgi:hypothetical protein